jgi:PDZ domain-containing protein
VTRKRAIVLLAGVLATALLAGGVAAYPVPYVVLEPGPTVDTLGKDVIAVSGADTSASAGQLRLTTIQVRTEITLPEALGAWADDDRALVPRTVVYPPGLSDQQVEQKNAESFSTSQRNAEAVARREVGRPFQVSFGAEDIGGPSAGLMFTLGLIDKLTPADLTGGRIIAGTGTVDEAGNVGRISGIPQKLLGAKAAGAQIFLVPADNCAEAVRNAVPGLPMAKVATVDDGLAALRTFTTGGTPPPCPGSP